MTDGDWAALGLQEKPKGLRNDEPGAPVSAANGVVTKSSGAVHSMIYYLLSGGEAYCFLGVAITLGASFTL